MTEAQKIREEMEAMMSTSAGRAGVLRLMDTFRTFAPFSSSEVDRILIGLREAGIHIHNTLLNHCPDLYIKAMQEKQEREQHNKEHEK